MTVANIPALLADLSPSWDAELTHLSVISITGEDAISYIQGQVTCNVESLAVGEHTFGAHCDFKGKMWSMFLAFRANDGLFLFMHHSATEKSLAELKKYGVFSKVTITDVSDEYALIGALPESDVFSKLNIDKDPTKNEDNIVIALTGKQPRYLLAFKSLEHELSSGSHVWEALNICEGIGSIQGVTSGEYVPQMLNLQALPGAIDFTKGCYMGQEVVARTKYLGKNKRAGYVLHCSEVTNIPVGAIIEQQLGENWRRAGQVLTSAGLAEENWVFAVLPNDIETATPLRLKEQPEVTFTIKPLPYTIED